MPAKRRVLMITYVFPPTGGAGVQRVTKFVKYLPHHGWLPSVLTVANPSVPLVDQSLGSDIPPETIVRRAKTWEPSYGFKTAVAADAGASRRRQGIVPRVARAAARRVGKILLQPDPQALWRPWAVREGKRLLYEVPHDAIVATGPPFSTFLVGAALSRKTGLPLVLDYRDEWDLSNIYWEHQRAGLLSRLIQRRMQNRVIRAAKAVIATTPSSARALEKLRNNCGSSASVAWIYNGFDAEDFPPSFFEEGPANAMYRLTYVGTLWTLTSPAALVAAVSRFSECDPILASRLELVFAGRRLPGEEQLLDRLKGLTCQVSKHPYVDHSEAMRLLWEADGLCVLMADLAGAGRVLPAKIFEYMAARRPILAIAPPGEVWELLRGHPAAHCFAPSDISGIANFLRIEVSRHQQNGHQVFPLSAGTAFDRRQQAGQLGGLLDCLLTATPSVPEGAY
jgi:glycosyltransferase involved in cell wall biosynthesis